MTIKIKHIIQAGNTYHISDLFKKILKLDSEKDYRVFVLDYKKIRSTQQNRYYWSCVVGELSHHTGYIPEEMHEILNHKFNLQTAYLVDEIIEYGSSTTLLNSKEFTDYIEKIKIWAINELNVKIPDPGELTDEVIVELINQGM